MRQISKTASVVVLACITVFSPLFNLPLIKVNAATSQWNYITDEAFADSNYYIEKIEQGGGVTYLLTDSNWPALNIYQVDSYGNYNIITEDLYEDPDNMDIIDFAYYNGNIYAIVRYLFDFSEVEKLMKYDGEVWTNVTDQIPDSANLGNLDFVSSTSNGMILWAHYLDCPEGCFYWSQGSLLDDEDVWTAISDDNTFDLTDYPYTDDFYFGYGQGSHVPVTIAEYSDFIYIPVNLWNDDIEEYQDVVLSYDTFTEEWSQVGDGFYGDDFSTIIDIAYLPDSGLWLTRSGSAEDPFELWVFDGDMWVLIDDTGFENSNNYEARLTTFSSGSDTYLLLGTTTYNSGTSEFWKYSNTTDEWEPIYPVYPWDGDFSDNSFVTDLYPGGYIAAATTFGEGLFDAQLWNYNEAVDWGGENASNTELWDDDDCTGIDFPLNFEFFGQDVSDSTLYVDTNGFASFDEEICDGIDDYNNVDLTDTDTWDGDSARPWNMALYPFWSDLTSEVGQNVFYKTIGEAPQRVFIVQWTNAISLWDESDNEPPVGTFQILFFEETNVVQFQYKYQLNGELGRGGEATIGLSQHEDIVVQYSYMEDVLSDGMAIKFSPIYDIDENITTYIVDDEADYYNIYLRDNNILSAPSLISPEYEENGLSTTPTLEWELDDDEWYWFDVVIAEQSDFSQGIIDGELDLSQNTIVFKGSVEDTEIDLSEFTGNTFCIASCEYEDSELEFNGLQNNTKYYWFVLAHGDINTEISGIGTFCTGDIECEEVDSTDSDGDGIPDSVENNGPNGGDANHDDIPDSEQANVTSFVNSITGHYAVLATSCAAIISVDMVNSNTLGSDTGFNYPVGLMNFTLQCEEGEIAEIEQYYYGDNLDSTLVVVRKYREGEGYKTIDDAEVSDEIEGALLIMYTIEDGGPLDDNGLLDGTIVDPSGPGINSAGAPNTGLGGLRMV